jgi:hypothetical protein
MKPLLKPATRSKDYGHSDFSMGPAYPIIAVLPKLLMPDSGLVGNPETILPPDNLKSGLVP